MDPSPSRPGRVGHGEDPYRDAPGPGPATVTRTQICRDGHGGRASYGLSVQPEGKLPVCAGVRHDDDFGSRESLERTPNAARPTQRPL